MKLYPTKSKKGSRRAKVSRLYWDTAATTPVSAEVLQEMKPFWADIFGNPSSISKEGVAARRALEAARREMGGVLGALPREILFTSGGTEGNNLAIAGTLGILPGKAAASAVEHPSVLEPLRALEKNGRKVFWISVDEKGRVNLSEIEEALAKGADLVSVMYANNEIGTIQPIREVVKLVRKERKRRNPKDPLGLYAPYLHVDACQAPGVLPIDFGRMGVDLATISAQKFYGPKGIGVLYVRGGVPLASQIVGGGHERGLRAGTENVPLVMGMARALRDAEKNREKNSARMQEIQNYFFERVVAEIGGVEINGSREDRLPQNAHFSFKGVSSEQIVLDLDAEGIAVSSGSACGTRDAEPSYVVRALGKGREVAESGVRFTWGPKTTKKEAGRVIKALKDSVTRHRRFMV